MSQDTARDRAIVKSLVRELEDNRSSDRLTASSQTTSDRKAPDDSPDPGAVLDAVETNLPYEEEIGFDADCVTTNLDELLLALIAFRGDADTHGKILLENIENTFGSHISSGTLYPRLYSLADSDILARRTRVNTKDYAIEDIATARNRLAESATQHIVLGLFLYTSLEGLSADRPD